MAVVRHKINVTTVEIMVADTANETLRKVSTRFPYKVKESKTLERKLKAQVESEGLSFVKISSITTEPKYYEMPAEMFVTMAREIKED